MCRREVFDAFLRNRAADLGTTLVNGLVQKIDTGTNREGPYTLHYADYSAGGPTGEAKTLEVDLIIGADGANSRGGQGQVRMPVITTPPSPSR